MCHFKLPTQKQDFYQKELVGELLLCLPMLGRSFSPRPWFVGVVVPGTFLSLYLVLIPVAGGVI